MQFEDRLKRDRELIEHALDGYFPELSSPPGGVTAAARYSLLSGGKRLRPAMLLECCRIYGGSEQMALPFACAVEMIHTYSLIHDDLPCMDNDDTRRGKPSCHRAFGEATALLAGDALLTRAFEIMAMAEGVQADRALRAIAYIAAGGGTQGMIGGQSTDLALEKADAVAPNVHLQMVSQKTAALIKAACAAGAILAGAAALEPVEVFAEGYGMAFQIADDIIDVTGTEAEIGKPVGSDARRGKLTFMSLYGERRCRELAREYLNAARGGLAQMPQSGFLSALCDMAERRER